MRVTSKEYQEHEVFSNLDKYIKFYDSLSMNIMFFMSMGTKAIINIDTYVYSSMQGTLESIKAVLKMGKINDSYSLLRKFYDSIYINVYTNLYLDDNHNNENFIVKQIQSWLEGTEQLPETRTISNYIRNHKKVKDLNDLLYRDKRYSIIRERCNDNAHYNFYKNVLLNDDKVENPGREKAMSHLSEDITQLIIYHLSYLFYMNEHYMMSSDYRDYLDVGETPPKDSQYWVATFIQNIFNDTIKPFRHDIANLIKDKTSMHLE